MQDGIGQPGDATKASQVVQVAHQRTYAQRTQTGSRLRTAHESEDAKASCQPGQCTLGNVATTDNKNSFHRYIISRTMPYQISLQPSGHAFAAEADRTILEAALEAGLLLPYSCRDGACGACKGKVVSGEVELGSHATGALSATDRDAGYTLFCRATPCSDLVLEVRSVTRVGDIPVKKLPCRVQKLERLANDVMLIELKLPASERFQFLAGQYVDILLADGQRRSFSIANAPHVEGHIELHVRLIPEGRFTGHVFNGMKEREILRFEGPLGSFWLREDSERPIVMIAGGTGFAPIKGMIEHAIHSGVTRPISLYWGARAPSGLYMDALARSWTDALPGLNYVPVISDGTPDDGWSGRRGLVHEAVLADFDDLSGHEVYACGAPAMIDTARSSLVTQRNLPEDAFFADAFTFSTPT